MEALLHDVAHYVALLVEAIVIAIIAIGSIEAIVNILRIVFTARATGIQKRAVWLEFGRWLVAALTFQLATVAAIRTFLSYFLDHEVESTRKLQYIGGSETEPSKAS